MRLAALPPPPGTIFAEYRDTDYGVEKRRDYRISFNLRDVGTFVDVSGGLDHLPF